MDGILNDLRELAPQLQKLTFSDRADPAFDYQKVCVRPFFKKGEVCYQLEQFKGAQVFHKNLDFPSLLSWVETTGAVRYRQLLLSAAGTEIQYTEKNGKTRRRVRETDRPAAAVQSHDRQKQYLLREGAYIPALIDLGVFTKDCKIVKSKYDKYKQINRFVELIDDVFQKSDKQELTILDFGCGKSYLTFILYYYFSVRCGMETDIIGYDLKRDVVERCTEIAARYGYKGLRFEVADVTKDPLADTHIDMVVTLHACDTATDYALAYAVKRGVRHIFSVPCCQHEVNLSIRKGGELDLLLEHGIIKERVSALLTDSIRAAVLEGEGYEVDMIEFVDFEHSPKNLMIRAKYTGRKRGAAREKAEALQRQYSFRQSLLELTAEKQ